jgi:predicted CXXCH cytochrome family protein
MKTRLPNPKNGLSLSGTSPALSVWLCLLGALLCAGPIQAASVLQSKHNLSVTGTGQIKATIESDTCIFCHTAHKAIPKSPLWNHASSGATYTPYSSSTTKATIGQPTGSSRLCLSCHDGTVALGSVNSMTNSVIKAVAMRNSMTTMPKGPANFGTDLSGDHPISFVYDATLVASDPQLKNSTMMTTNVKLDSNKELQCTTCHDAHDNRFGKFLVQNNDGGVLCLNCHVPTAWTGSIHNTSPARWNGQGQNPWPSSTRISVAANACDNCHTSHNAGTKARLLTAATEEQSCYVCHSGTVAAKNVQNEFGKFSSHPVTVTGHLHDPAEDLINPPRHVACADCHNPHASRAVSAAKTEVKTAMASSPLAGVKAVSAAGTLVNPAIREYQLCFRCHADSRDKAAAVVSRQYPQTNKRLQFAPSNASFHPLETIGRNPSVPSLIAPLTISSIISCTDCHNNDQGPGAGGVGPSGPHGSIYAPLLERQLVTADFTPESGASYALCYKCHSRNSILSNQSFPGHADHIIKYQTACTTCHDSHGVAGAPGLINFNVTYVTPGLNRRLSYTSAGPNRANCTLTCHGSIHNGSTYDNPAVSLRRLARH